MPKKESRERRPRRSPEFWRELVERVGSSDKGAREACAEEGVPLERYYYWRRKFRGESRLAESDSTLPTTTSFREYVIPTVSDAELEIRTATGASVVVRGNVSGSQLKMVLTTLQEVQ